MRVAALYDIHGNFPALEAVLDEVDRASPEIVVVGGDVASGPMPGETLDRLMSLGDEVVCIHGNADRELVRHFDEPSELRGTLDEGDVWLLRGEWAARQLTRDQRDFLARLPATVTLEIEGVGRTLFCHGSPRSDEEIITRVTPEPRLRRILSAVEERVVVCGHTHVQFDRTIDGTRVVNAGSVGMPYEAKPAAYWALLGPDIQLKRADYDVQAAAAEFRSRDFPACQEFLDETLLAPPDPVETSRLFEETAAKREATA